MCRERFRNQGCRPEEITQLAKKDVNFETNKFFVFGKTPAAKRWLDMTAETRAILQRRMEGESRWILPSKRKRGAHIGRLNSAHDRIVAEAAREGTEINWVIYDFRHTFATRLAENNIDLPTLAALLGHESTRCVHKYVHPTAEHKKDAMRRYDHTMRKRARKRKTASVSRSKGRAASRSARSLK